MKKKFVVNPFILSGVLLVLLILGGMLSLQTTKSNERELASLWKAEQQFDKLDSIALTGDLSELQALLVDLQKSRLSYVKQRALFMDAMLAYQQEDYARATEQFMLLGQKFTNSYLAPVATLNAAYGYEQLGNLDKAKELFVKLAKNEKALTWGEATFNVARLNEDKMDMASELYYKLVEKLEETNLWRQVAENRLIALGLL